MYADEGRPAIPAELRRRVLVEAGHRCAIPTCRYIEIDIHHIVPWADVKTHEYENLIALCPNCHRRADRGDIDRKSLRLYKVNLRSTHDKFSQLEMDVVFELYAASADQCIQFPAFNMILLKRALDAGLVQAIKPPGISMRANGMEMAPLNIVLTPKGRAYVLGLGDHEI